MDLMTEWELKYHLPHTDYIMDVQRTYSSMVCIEGDSCIESNIAALKQYYEELKQKGEENLNGKEWQDYNSFSKRIEYMEFLIKYPGCKCNYYEYDYGMSPKEQKEWKEFVNSSTLHEKPNTFRSKIFKRIKERFECGF